MAGSECRRASVFHGWLNIGREADLKWDREHADMVLLRAEHDVLVAALRMCGQALSDYLTMSEDEATCRRQFSRCRDAVQKALNGIDG
jgi:hypothetical protein